MAHLPRWLALLVGCALSSLCYALIIRAGLGLAPLWVVQDGLARHLGVSIGLVVVVSGLALVAVSAALGVLPGVGTLLVPVLGGWVLDAVLPDLPLFHGIGLRFLVVVVATWFMCLSGVLIMEADLGLAAIDGIMVGLHGRTGRPLAPVRLAMEASMLAGGWLLGGRVGIGTVVTAALIGPGMQHWSRVLARRPGRRPSTADRRRRRPPELVR